MKNFCELCYALNGVEERVPSIGIVEEKKDTEFTLDKIRRKRAACLLVPYGLKFCVKALLNYFESDIGDIMNVSLD
jgi:hypothetical protein